MFQADGTLFFPWPINYTVKPINKKALKVQTRRKSNSIRNTQTRHWYCIRAQKKQQNI